MQSDDALDYEQMYKRKLDSQMIQFLCYGVDQTMGQRLDQIQCIYRHRLAQFQRVFEFGLTGVGVGIGQLSQI